MRETSAKVERKHRSDYGTKNEVVFLQEVEERKVLFRGFLILLPISSSVYLIPSACYVKYHHLRVLSILHSSHHFLLFNFKISFKFNHNFYQDNICLVRKIKQ